jgi:hypothetical protein
METLPCRGIVCELIVINVLTDNWYRYGTFYIVVRCQFLKDSTIILVPSYQEHSDVFFSCTKDRISGFVLLLNF